MPRWLIDRESFFTHGLKEHLVSYSPTHSAGADLELAEMIDDREKFAAFSLKIIYCFLQSNSQRMRCSVSGLASLASACWSVGNHETAYQAQVRSGTHYSKIHNSVTNCKLRISFPNTYTTSLVTRVCERVCATLHQDVCEREFVQLYIRMCV